MKGPPEHADAGRCGPDRGERPDRQHGATRPATELRDEPFFDRERHLARRPRACQIAQPVQQSIDVQDADEGDEENHQRKQREQSAIGERRRVGGHVVLEESAQRPDNEPEPRASPRHGLR